MNRYTIKNNNLVPRVEGGPKPGKRPWERGWKHNWQEAKTFCVFCFKQKCSVVYFNCKEPLIKNASSARKPITKGKQIKRLLLLAKCKLAAFRELTILASWRKKEGTGVFRECMQVVANKLISWDKRNENISSCTSAISLQLLGSS